MKKNAIPEHEESRTTAVATSQPLASSLKANVVAIQLTEIYYFLNFKSSQEANIVSHGQKIISSVYCQNF